jgi:hypothetical protein
VAVSAPLQVSIGELRDLAAKLSGHADDIAGIDPSHAAEDAAAAMPNTAVGGECGALAGPIAEAYLGLARQVRRMAANVTANAGSYQATEAALTAQLREYEAGVR